MARGSADPYGSEGSIPNQQPLQGSGAGPLSVRASPEDFGSQIGAGVQKVGETAEGLAEKYGNIVNENLMTKADVDFTTKLGQLKADYTSKTGMAAYNAYPQYQKDVAQAFQDSRANLPLGAQHGFDMLGARTMGNHIADGSSFATSQLKEAQRDLGSQLTNANIEAVLDPSVASDRSRVDEHIGHALYGAQMQMDENHPGLKTDHDTGEVGFDESKPEGQGLKAQYEAQRDDIITRIQSNRFDVLSKNDALGAYGMYLNERSDLPKQTQVALDAKFEPIVFNAHKDNAVGHAVAQSQGDYAKVLYNPDASKMPLDTVQKNEGKMSDDGQSAYGIDKNAHPKEFAEISSLPESDRSNYARNFFKEEYYDKKHIGDLPEDTRSIVMDGIVNHTTDFGNKLIQDAKNGTTPQQLIDERRAEYQRVAQIPGKEQYLQGWNNRLDNLQNTIGQPKKSYTTNPDGSMLTQADYYRTHSEDVYAKGDAYAESVMPGDLAFKRSVRETVGNYMSKTIANQSQQYMLDNKNVMRGVTGELTKGNPPATEQELRAIPGMNDLLNNVAAHDPKFSESIPRLVAQAQKQNITTNSSNAFETITRALQPQDEDHPNHIKNQGQLDTLLGKSDGTGINMKDYNDAKPATELPSTIKEPLLKSMQEIANANGNIDGKGQQRAIQWYNQVMDAYKKNESMGDKKDPNFADTIGKPEGAIYTPPTPSRMTQLANWAKEASGLGHVLVKNSDGQQGYIPAGNVEKALKLGYTKVE